ncbi:MAG: SDR family oxidoreductase [Ignavibacteria bacterium]|jgi:uncharacterized protein YbjT (DUF2867 family)
MTKVLLAGATGYLGGFILKELDKRNYFKKILVRKSNKNIEEYNSNSEIITAEVTKPETLKNILHGVDVVISTVGITKQKDGLTYMDVDYRANLNLLNESIKNNVKKFIYVSVLNGEKLKHLKICEAKEKFVDELKKSGIDYCVVRPNGFFSDMSEFFNMALKGKIYLFGDGSLKSNPIHGEDLAEVCVDCIELKDKEINVGGPEILTQNEIANAAFKVAGKEVKISYIPDWIRKLGLKFVRTFMNSKSYGPIEFFMTVMVMNMVAPKYGTHRLEDFFKSMRNK